MIGSGLQVFQGMGGEKGLVGWWKCWPFILELNGVGVTENEVWVTGGLYYSVCV